MGWYTVNLILYIVKHFENTSHLYIMILKYVCSLNIFKAFFNEKTLPPSSMRPSCLRVVPSVSGLVQRLLFPPLPRHCSQGGLPANLSCLHHSIVTPFFQHKELLSRGLIIIFLPYKSLFFTQMLKGFFFPLKVH